MERLTLLFLRLKERGFFHLIISNYSVQFIVFGSSLLVAKIMSPTYVGIIKTIETFANMAIVIGGGGALFAILKIVPENPNRQLRSLSIRFSLKYVTIFSFMIFLVFNAIAYFGLMSDDPKLIKWFHIYSWIIVPTTLTQLLTRYYQAIDRFKRISTVIFYIKLITAVIVLFLTYYFFIEGYVLSMVITTILGLLILLYDLRKNLFVKTKESFRGFKKQIIKLSKSAFYAQLIDQLKIHSGFFIANYLIFDRAMFGNYAFALILIQGLNIMSTSVQQFIIPKMSQTSGALELFFSKLRFFERRFILFSAFIFIVAQLVFPFIIGFIFGNKYDDAIPLLRIMLFGWFVQSLYALKGVVFLSLGKMKYISYSSLWIFGLSVPFMYLLVLQYGATGAAFSFILQQLIGFIILTYYTQRIANNSLRE